MGFVLINMFIAFIVNSYDRVNKEQKRLVSEEDRLKQKHLIIVLYDLWKIFY